jgi:hypothetical protein
VIKTTNFEHNFVPALIELETDERRASVRGKSSYPRIIRLIVLFCGFGSGNKRILTKHFSVTNVTSIFFLSYKNSTKFRLETILFILVVLGDVKII